MPPQYTPPTPPSEAVPVAPEEARPRHRRAWLSAALGAAVVAAVAVAAILRGPIGAPSTLAPAASQVPPSRPAATPGVAPSTTASAPARPSARAGSSARPSPRATARPQTRTRGWPGAHNTGVPHGVALRSCAGRITSGGTYDRCRFDGDVTVLADNVRITRSLIKGSVNAGDGEEQTGLVIRDTTIDCGCLADDTHSPAAIMDSNYTLVRVDIFNAGHGAAVKHNVTIQDSYIHDLGADTEAHKDGIYSGDGSNVVIRHNTIECNDGFRAGCTAAIGLLTDFGPISHWTIDNNLLNTSGSFCFYGSGGPQKNYTSHHIVFINNHFGRSVHPNCGGYGPVTYFDVDAPGNEWRGNVWHDSGAPARAQY